MRKTVICFISILVMGWISAGYGQESDLPAAAEILDRYVEVTGGKAAYDRIRNRVSKALMEIQGMGIQIEARTYAAKPNLSYAVIDSEITGKMENGCDGTNVWEFSDMQGAQVKEGQEKIDMLHLSRFDAPVYWREAFQEVKTVGIADVKGKPAYRVLVTPEGAKPQTMYFDVESGLLVRTDMELENPMGTFPIETYSSDYREVDGILFSYTSEVHVMGQVRTVTLQEIEHNADLPEDRFEPPDEILEILEQL